MLTSNPREQISVHPLCTDRLQKKVGSPKEWRSNKVYTNALRSYKGLGHVHRFFPDNSTDWWTFPFWVQTGPLSLTGRVCLTASNRGEFFLSRPWDSGMTSFKNSCATSPSSSARSLSENHVSPCAHRTPEVRSLSTGCRILTYITRYEWY